MTRAMRRQGRTFAAIMIVSLVAPFDAAAHHGANTNPELYLAENLVELNGEISRVLWRNPHPRLKMIVVDENGDSTEWELELAGSLQSYARAGINRDFFSVGDRVKAAGVVSRRNAESIGVVNLLLPGGDELVSGNRPLRWSDSRFGGNASAGMGAGPASPAAIAAAEASANGIFRVWGRRTSPRPAAQQYAGSLSETGRETFAQYFGPRDNPDYDCRTGMPHHMFDPLPMEITDGGDQIHIETLEYNVRRVIYLSDDRPEPTPSNVGYSVGRWEGDTLVVETTHVDWKYFDPFGTPQSDQVSYVETFRVADDDSQLNYSIVATDPVMFSEPIRLERAWRWQPGTEMFEFDCVPEWENAGAEAAQDEPMVFLTSHSAAGSSGVTAGIMAPRLEEYLGRPIEFKYSQGSSAAVGDPPDGNTMLVTTIGLMALHPVWIPDYELNPLTDLRPVTRLAVTPDILIVRSGLGVDTIDELVAYAANAEQPLSYYPIAPFSIHRVELAAIFNEFGIDNVALASSMGRGPVQALAAIEAGTLDVLAVTSPYVVPLLEKGAAKALVVIHRERTPVAPDVPTLQELGITTMPYGSWSAVFVPAGTSDEDTNLVFEAIKFAVSDPDVEKQINDLGMEVDLNESSEEFVSFLKSESKRLSVAVDKYGLRDNL